MLCLLCEAYFLENHDKKKVIQIDKRQRNQNVYLTLVGLSMKASRRLNW